MKIPSNKRKQAKDALLEHERNVEENYTEMESIYSTSPLGMCFMDTDLRYLRCNETLAEINGLPAADHIGRTLREIVPEVAEKMESVYRKVIETGEPVIDIEASMAVGTDSHKLRYFSACYYPVKSEDGVIRGISSIVQEITERKETEVFLRDAHLQLEKRVQERTKELHEANSKLQLEHDALLESEQRYRQLVESTNVIPWEADANTWQFTYIGPQATKLFGFSVEQWYEKDFWIDHIHPDDRDYAINYCQEYSQHHNEFSFDYRIIAANGRVIWLHDIVNVKKNNGELVKLRGFMIDITERKISEENLHKAVNEASIHRERLAHLIRVQTLGEMATGIAHEINQPLAAIESYAMASQKHLQTGKASKAKMEELLEKISGQAKRAGSVVSRLRTMMQRRRVNTILIDINKLVDEVAMIAEIDTRHHNCRLILKFTPSLPKVIGDEVQIQQVILNLIRNAIDAIEGLTDKSENEINVETKRKDDNSVEISITDYGHGISESDAGNIFEAFYSTKDSGLGMGLTICKNIIDSHGGKIGFTSDDTGRTTFYFTLPVEDEKD